MKIEFQNDITTRIQLQFQHHDKLKFGKRCETNVYTIANHALTINIQKAKCMLYALKKLFAGEEITCALLIII